MFLNQRTQTADEINIIIEGWYCKLSVALSKFQRLRLQPKSCQKNQQALGYPSLFFIIRTLSVHNVSSMRIISFSVKWFLQRTELPSSQVLVEIRAAQRICWSFLLVNLPSKLPKVLQIYLYTQRQSTYYYIYLYVCLFNANYNKGGGILE